ncbi:DUF1707 SHOCT-like domain-containing protein [Geodermatophilus sp. SYSU D00815]
MEAPRIRAGDADRSRVVERLGRHLGEGRLTVAEFDERVAAAYAAVHLDELPALTADLPPDPPPAVERAPVPRRPAPAWRQPAVVQLLLVLIAMWSVAAVAAGVPPVLPLVLGFLLLRQHRWRGHG